MAKKKVLQKPARSEEPTKRSDHPPKLTVDELNELDDICCAVDASSTASSKREIVNPLTVKQLQYLDEVRSKLRTLELLISETMADEDDILSDPDRTRGFFQVIRDCVDITNDRLDIIVCELQGHKE